MAAANSTGRSGTAGRRQTRMRSALVIAEVALSIVLLLGAGLLMRSFISLIGVDLGFETRNLIVTDFAFPPAQPASNVDRRGFYRQAVDRIHTIPGVRAVTISRNYTPFGGMNSPLEIPGSVVPAPASALVQFCSDEFADTLGLRLAPGRRMSTNEVNAAHKIAIVNETLVKRYFSGQDPLGRTVRLPRLATLKPRPVADPTFTIVGVVSDITNQGPQEQPAPQVYVPYTLVGLGGGGSFAMWIRTSSDVTPVLAALKTEIQTVDRQVALVQPSSLERLLQTGPYAQPRFSLLVLGMFACAGLVLVAFGVYGVLAYTVSQQSREIAIRMALGGDRRHVLRMIFSMGLRLLGAGIVVGLAAGVATNRLLVNQLWNTSPHDPLTLVAAVSVILIFGMFACWVPAHRAIRVEPIVALRHE